MSAPVRPQYHFRRTSAGLCAWDVRRLIELSSGLVVVPYQVSTCPELDVDHWYRYGGGKPTPRSICVHVDLIKQADLGFPIILAADGGVMDGMHRICRAYLEGRASLPSVRFESDPEPDFVGVRLEDLPYEDS